MSSTRHDAGSLPVLRAALLGLLVFACSPATDPAEGRLYVTSGFTDEIWILDATDGSEIARRTVNRRMSETDEPHGVAVSPDGSHWYATLAHGAPTLWKYEGSGDRLVGRLELETRGASRIGLTPDGTRAFVPDYWRGDSGPAGEIVMVRLDDLAILARTTTCAAPHDAQPSPDGAVVAVTCALSDEVMLLDAATLEQVARFPVATDAAREPAPDRPMNATWSADGAVLYVTAMSAAEVRAFDRDGTLTDRVTVGLAPAQIIRAGGTLVTANRGDRSISVIETEPELREVARLDLPGADHPHGVAVGPSGTIVYVAFEGTVDTPGGVVAIDLLSHEELWRTRLGSYVLGIAWGPPDR